MRILDVLRKECVVAGARFENKSDVLKEIAHLAKKCPALQDITEDAVLTGLQEREELGSTGFGKGIAIPHCRIKSISEFVVGIVTIPDGVDFDALDEKKVKLIIFIIAPENESNKHLKLLSTISQTLLIPGVYKELLAEKTTEALYESFMRHTHAEISIKKQTTKVMLNVFIHNEEFFLEILEKLNGIETGSVVVASAENPNSYLAKVPLFANFWRDSESNFSKIIIMVIDKRLFNEVIRSIESIAGNLNGSKGILVTAQELTYAAGAI